MRKAQVSKIINPPTAFEHVFWHISPQDLSKPDKTFSHCKILGLFWDCMQQSQLTQQSKIVHLCDKMWAEFLYKFS